MTKSNKRVLPNLESGKLFKVIRFGHDHLRHKRNLKNVGDNYLIHRNDRYIFTKRFVNSLSNPQLRLRKTELYRVLYTFEHPCGGKTIYVNRYGHDNEYILFSFYFDPRNGGSYRQQSNIVCQDVWIRTMN